MADTRKPPSLSDLETRALALFLLVLAEQSLACDAEPRQWITINGAHIPLDEDGEPMGKVGEKIRQGGKSFDEYKKQFGGDHQKAAKEFYKKELKDHPTKARKELDNKPVNFGGGKDEEKIHQGLNDPVKAEAIQHVRDVIETGTHHGPLYSYKREQGLSDRYSEYHYFQKEIPMNGSAGKLLRVHAGINYLTDKNTATD